MKKQMVELQTRIFMSSRLPRLMKKVVSDSIKVAKILKKPFTLNKNNSLSKKSVNKVNKILDNWEKELIDI